jgi:hypothetical protein
MSDQSDSKKKIPWNGANPLARVAKKQPGTGRAYEETWQNAALRDYYALGADRSLDRLHKIYTRACPDEDLDFVAMWEGRPAGKRPPTVRRRTLEYWSAANDWQARIDAMDDLTAAAELDRLNALVEEGKRLVVVKGVEQGRFFLATVERIQAGISECLAALDADPAAQNEENVPIAPDDLDALLDLADLHLKGATMVRRAVGLPDKYTQTNLAGVEDGAPIKVKGYSVVSPDDWDELDEPDEGDEGGSDGDV